MVTIVSLTGLLIAICATQVAADIKLASFKRDPQPKLIATSLDDPWKESTLLACVGTCLRRHEPCKRVTYNPKTGACTSGTGLTFSPAVAGQTNDQMLYHRTPNDMNKLSGNYNNRPGCNPFISKEKVSYKAAKQTCEEMGCRLFVVSSLEKLNQLRSIVKNITQSPTWIGLNDLKKENTFVWEDGQEMDKFSYPVNWRRGQPDNAGGNEDCVEIGSRNDFQSYNDENCDKNAHFICEMS